MEIAVDDLDRATASWYANDCRLTKERRQQRVLGGVKISKTYDSRDADWAKGTGRKENYNPGNQEGSGMKFSEEIEALLPLAKDPANYVGALKRPDGANTRSGKETLEILL